MTPSEHIDPEIRNRSNELLRAAGYRLEESTEQVENRNALSSREIKILLLLGVLFSAGFIIFTHLSGIDAEQRNHQMLAIAKWFVLASVILQFIRLCVPLGSAKPKFVRVMLAFVNFALSFCVTLLLVVAIP